MGNYYLLLAILSLLTFVFMEPFKAYYSRHLIGWSYSNNVKNATNILIVSRIIVIFFSLIIALTLFIFLDYSKYYSLSEFVFFVMFSMVAGMYMPLIAAVNILGDRVDFIIYMVLSIVLGLFFSLLIVYFIDKSAMGWLYGIALSQFLFSIILYIKLTKNQIFSFEKVKSLFERESMKNIIIFMIPISVTLFLQWGQNQSFIFIIEAKYSLEALAYIGVGLAISKAIFSAAESLATQFYYPIYLRKITHASKKDRAIAWNDLANYMIPIYLILAVYIIILAPYLTKLLVASKFYEAYVYAMFGAMIEFFRVITNLVYTVSQSEVKTKTTILPYTVGFILTISSLYFFDMSEKLWMIPLFVGLANGVIFFLLFKNMKKLLDIKIDFINILKSFVLVLPLFLVLLIPNSQDLLQTILIISISGIYFIFLIYYTVQKNISRSII